MSLTDFHPELRSVARYLPRAPISPVTLPVIRRLERLYRFRRPSDVEVLTTSGGIQIRLHRPPQLSEPGPALLWIHGGGYMFGTAQQDDRLCRRLARQLGITVAATEYRLAPEHPYPAGLDDCHTALTWLSRLPAVDASRIAIGGASAGGGLAAALAFTARDRGEITPAAQLLVYPMLDDRSVHHTHLDDLESRLWNRRSNKFGWRAYLGGADPAVAVPARRTDLAGLAPAWIGVGTLDLFHDEDVAYARALRAADVACELEVVDGAFHGFDQIVSRSSIAQRFFDGQAAHLQTAFA
ncbi:MAG: alpha/beta hydrolase [Mycobacterium sp.]